VSRGSASAEEPTCLLQKLDRELYYMPVSRDRELYRKFFGGLGHKKSAKELMKIWG